MGTVAMLSSGGPALISDAVVPNDNRTPAGVRHGDTLEVHLEVRTGIWHPESEGGPAVPVYAFAEEGQAPRIPGPLIRVPEGTTIVATIRNALADSTIAVHGLVSHPGSYNDSLVLRPGEVRELRFNAGTPGTYVYAAFPGKHNIDRHINDERETLSGVFVVDPAGGSPADRIFMINIWGNRKDSVEWRQNDYQNAITINGRAWPWTERISATTGDTLRWRVINGSGRTHPMHLHGFYFDVATRGNGFTDTSYATARAAVTEEMRPLTTMAMSFVTSRPGNWLFHCHVGFHVTPQARWDHGSGTHDAMAHDARQHMAGLTLGITVAPRPGWQPAPRVGVRRIHLFIQEGRPHSQAPRALGFVLQRDDRRPRPDSVEIPGSVLVLQRGQPTDIVVINRLTEPSSIHWHGIELESYSDGVSGWSGAPDLLAPSIMPGDSFVAHLTLPRAGTFIYHTHLNDLEQLSSGLYGAIVVLEPGTHFDPAHDHVYVAGWDGPVGDPVGPVIVNGGSTAPPLHLEAGVPHRFRFVNIGIALPVTFRIVQDTTVQQWRRLAKDGADLPAARAVAGASRQLVQVGETYDFELTPRPGEYRLTVSAPQKVFFTQRLVVQ